MDVCAIDLLFLGAGRLYNEDGLGEEENTSGVDELNVSAGCWKRAGLEAYWVVREEAEVSHED